MFNAWISIAVVLCIFVSLSYAQDDGAESSVSIRRRLHNKLLADYQRFIRPVKDESESVQVSLFIYLSSLDEINEQAQTIRVTGIMNQYWTDFQLKWNPEDFGGLRTTEIHISDIWNPDITVVDSKDMYDRVGEYQTIVVYYTGLVEWFSRQTITTHCYYMDLTHFPYDSHECKIRITSWTYPTSKVNTSVGTFMNMSLTQMTNNNLGQLKRKRNNWDVTDFKITTEEWWVNDPLKGEDSKNTLVYDPIICSLFLRRISGFTSHLFVAPSVILCFSTLAVFLLPSASHEKITLGVGLLISDVLLLGELIRFLPTAYRTMPLLGKYLLANIVLTSLSLVISTIVINVWGRSRTRLNMPGPAFIRLIILGPVAKLLCVSEDQYCDSKDDKPDDHGNSVSSLDSDNIQNDPSAQSNEARSRELKIYLRRVAMSQWSQLAVVIDRFFIILYLLVITGLTLAFTQYM